MVLHGGSRWCTLNFQTANCNSHKGVTLNYRINLIELQCFVCFLFNRICHMRCKFLKVVHNRLALLKLMSLTWNIRYFISQFELMNARRVRVNICIFNQLKRHHINALHAVNWISLPCKWLDYDGSRKNLLSTMIDGNSIGWSLNSIAGARDIIDVTSLLQVYWPVLMWFQHSSI